MQFNLEIKNTNELSNLELLEVMKARVAVFVVEQNCPYQEVDDKDNDARHVMLKTDGHIAAYTRIIEHDDQIHISFGRVLVVKQYRGQQLGRKIVQTTIDEIHRLYPDKGIKIQGQNYLRQFYESFGFEAVSDVYLEDDIPHLDLVLGD